MAQRAPFYALSPAKLLFLSATTGGLFQFWWTHKNWVAIRDLLKARVSPFWRTFFGIFFCYPQFARIARLGRENGLSPLLWPGPIAAGYVVTFLITGLTGGLLAVSCALPLLPVNALLARLNETLLPDTPPVVPWTRLNVAWLILVGLFALLVVAAWLRAAR